MKMLGFMIAMTFVYWIMANYAQSIIASPIPCPVEADIASVSMGEARLASPVMATDESDLAERRVYQLAQLSPQDSGLELSCAH